MILPLIACLLAPRSPESRWFPEDPGPAISDDSSGKRVLRNRVVRLAVEDEGARIVFEDLIHKTSLVVDAPSIEGGGAPLKFGRAGAAFDRELRAEPESPIAARHAKGYEITLLNASFGAAYKLEWSFELRDGSNYVRESLK